MSIQFHKYGGSTSRQERGSGGACVGCALRAAGPQAATRALIVGALYPSKIGLSEHSTPKDVLSRLAAELATRGVEGSELPGEGHMVKRAVDLQVPPGAKPGSTLLVDVGGGLTVPTLAGTSTSNQRLCRCLPPPSQA